MELSYILEKETPPQKIPYIFSKESFSYKNGKRKPWKTDTPKKVFIFPETELSYISLLSPSSKNKKKNHSEKLLIFREMELSSDNPEKQKFLIFSEKQKNQFLACA